VPSGLKIIGYGLDDRGDRIPAEAKMCFFSKNAQNSFLYNK